MSKWDARLRFLQESQALALLGHWTFSVGYWTFPVGHSLHLNHPLHPIPATGTIRNSK
jgi:hypothetical protein